MHLLAPAPMGGLERVLEALATGLQLRGHRVCVGAVLTPDADEPGFLAALREAGVTVVALRIPSRAYRLEKRLIGELIGEFHPDIVHTHGYRSDLLGAWAARAAGVPVVTTLHGFTVSDWKNRLYQALQRTVVSRFDAVVAVSQPIAHRMIRAGTDPRRLHIVPNALKPRQVLDRALARKTLELDGANPVIGWVGRMSPDKGVDVFVRSLPFVRDLPWGVCLIGDGPDAPAAKQYVIEQGLSDRVFWVGAVPDAARLMRAFDVFVLSSRTEGTPIVLLEAMAAEVSVVATRVGGVPDVVGDDQAWLVPSQDPAALAGALRASLLDPRAATRRAAASTRLEQFTIDPWLDRYEQVYRATLQGKRDQSA